MRCRPPQWGRGRGCLWAACCRRNGWTQPWCWDTSPLWREAPAGWRPGRCTWPSHVRGHHHVSLSNILGHAGLVRLLKCVPENLLVNCEFTRTKVLNLILKTRTYESGYELNDAYAIFTHLSTFSTYLYLTRIFVGLLLLNCLIYKLFSGSIFWFAAKL